MCILSYQKIFDDYIANAIAYANVWIEDIYMLNIQSEPDEPFMLAIEKEAGFPQTRVSSLVAYDFRRQIRTFVGHMIEKRKQVLYSSSPMAKAIKNYTKRISRPVDILPFDLSWKSDIVYKIAEDIVKGNKWRDLPVLADALEDANCACQVRLNHLRQDAKDVEWCYITAEILGEKCAS